MSTQKKEKTSDKELKMLSSKLDKAYATNLKLQQQIKTIKETKLLIKQKLAYIDGTLNSVYLTLETW